MLRLKRRRFLAYRRVSQVVSALWFRAPVARDVVLLALGWLLLSIIVNVRYPAREPSLWYLVPALDVTLIFAAFTVAGALKVRIARPVLVVLALLFAFVRLFRLADGITLRMQHRTINLFIDSQLFPDLVRLAYTTVPTPKLVSMVLAGSVLLGMVAWLAFRALEMASRALRERRRATWFGMLVVTFLVLGPLVVPRRVPEWYRGAFAASVVPRFGDDFATYWAARSFPEQVRRQIAARGELDAGSGMLSGLRGANVLLMFVESYGETLLHLDDYREPIDRAYKRWESTLSPLGFHMASIVTGSPTVGGYSWLAHLTLATGIKVSDQARYKRLYAMKPKTIVHYFVDAGYDTLIVQPATMQEPGPLIYPFHKHRYSWEFGYQGRNFSWAPMPDQFALDFVYRNEIAGAGRPLFVEYNLVSGHMPWNDQAPIVDWDIIGNGALFRNMEGIRFDTDWSDLRGANQAYLAAMLYDLEVLRQYLERFVHDDTLLIFLGDHQPVGEVTGHSKSWGVPMHVVSRNPRFVEKFIARGYSRGMRPQNSPPYPGMETFLEAFIEDFSTP